MPHKNPLPRASRIGLLALSVAGLWAPDEARAFVDDIGSRGVAMGGAGRADARGDEAPLLNPSGMSLAKLYTVQGHYQLTSPGGGQLAHVSVVDSTSAFNLSGGIYYTYRNGAVDGFSRRVGHEGGVALSAPFGQWVMFGVTGKYLHVTGGAPEADGSTNHDGFTLDAGLTLRPAAILTLGVVGYNLRDPSTSLAPTSMGYGAAVNPIADLTIAVDLFHDFTTSDGTRGVRTTIAAGADYTWAQRTAFRVGGGRDGGRERGYLSGGFAAISDMGAVDLSVSQDVTGTRKLTILVVSLRVFVPQP